ncbi:MAG: cation:proton antiporter [Anaerolineae bacterium]|nr:cation:proton antiporter [Anaerolineae bacterium]
MKKHFLFYLLFTTIFGLLIWFIIVRGKQLEAGRDLSGQSLEIPATTTQASPLEAWGESLTDNLGHPLSLLLLQIAVIILCARLLGFLFGKFGQPAVIGEIIAGIVLGPSLLGWLWPQVSGWLFRPDSLPTLQFFSQLGLLLFMFIIGLELDVSLLKNKAQAAVVVSHAGIVFPFFLGVWLAYGLFSQFAPGGVSFVAFGLFMGIAMSITAFPVLARIIQERGLTQSPLGALAITCAAADDVTAWCLLAAIVALIQAGTAMTALFTVLLAVIYVGLMFLGVRPLLQRLSARYGQPGQVNKTFVAALFIVLFLSALTTEVIGIHALFGAFLAGAMMPSAPAFRHWLIARIADVSLVILLPLFFAFTGLKTQIGLLNNGALWLICGLIILVAVVGKFGGSLVAARFTGQSWADSCAIGALMNTRGLMELVVLNIGYDLGILSPTIFTMMVLMALITTFMTTPALSLIDYLSRKSRSLPLPSLSEKTL